jgi:transport and Golgi organization protein 2
MCTVSWVHEDDGYQLLCNRDELRTRAEAYPPQIVTREGIRCAAPVDGDCGGTWIGVNEFGVSLCLLNGAPRAAAPLCSRGFIVRDLLPGGPTEGILARALRMDLTMYAPFTLVALEPCCPAALVEWSGTQRTITTNADSRMPLISSSLDTEGVIARRGAAFRHHRAAAGRLDSRTLRQFHESHGAEPGPDSACMHRTDAQTVSFSWIKVSSARIEFLYTPGPPCLRRSPYAPIFMDRTQHARQ